MVEALYPQHFHFCISSFSNASIGSKTRNSVFRENNIALDKLLFFNQKVMIFFLFLHKNICCGYSLEAHWRGASNEYPQHMFSWRNKKNVIWIPTLIKGYFFKQMSLHCELQFFYCSVLENQVKVTKSYQFFFKS